MPWKIFHCCFNLHYMQFSDNKIVLVEVPEYWSLAVCLSGRSCSSGHGAFVITKHLCLSNNTYSQLLICWCTICRFQNRWLSNTIYQQMYPLYRCTCCFQGLRHWILLKNKEHFAKQKILLPSFRDLTGSHFPKWAFMCGEERKVWTGERKRWLQSTQIEIGCKDMGKWLLNLYSMSSTLLDVFAWVLSYPQLNHITLYIAQGV